MLVVGIVGIYLAAIIFSPSSEYSGDKIVTIPTGSSYEEVYSILEKNDIKLNEWAFDLICNQMNYVDNVKPGRYKIPENSSMIAIIRLLRSGKQDAVEVTIHREDTPYELAGKIASYLEFDSSQYAHAFTSDSLLSIYDLDTTSFMSYIIPNTYFMYYNAGPQDVLERFIREHDKFWQRNNRIEKAQAMDMTPLEVYTLASIVERESQYAPERPRIAGVYINRLNSGIPLQADPTVIYAMGDPDIHRVLKKYLDIDSPYNTYKYAGLPPGPIGTASISSIDAVLNYEHHGFFYFCAKADNSGTHAFAKTLAGHLRNARKFQRWLDSQGVYR